jgi:hypothetical protein
MEGKEGCSFLKKEPKNFCSLAGQNELPCADAGGACSQ